MKTFAQFLSGFMKERDRLAKDLEISKSVLKRWATGEHNPHPVIRKAVIDYLNYLELDRDGNVQGNQEYTQKVMVIFKELDPQGLIKMGAPEDEYDSEAQEIARLSFLCHTLEEMTQGVWAVFVTNFSPSLAGPMESYQQVAAKVFELKRTFDLG